MSRIGFDPRAAQRNSDLAQRAMFTAAAQEQFQKARNAANMRAAVLSGLAIGVLVSAAQVFGVI